MKLLAKFNLILLVLFGAGTLVISQLSYNFLIQNASREVMQEAELMMASARSVRDYTAEDLKPLLEKNPEHTKRFLPETIPAFGATSTFNRLKQKYPDYTYREVSVNPTNPEDRATDWEADILAYMRDHSDRKPLIGDRDTPAGPAMYLASGNNSRSAVHEPSPSSGCCSARHDWALWPRPWFRMEGWLRWSPLELFLCRCQCRWALPNGRFIY